MAHLDITHMAQCKQLSQDTANIGGYDQTGLGGERRYPQCSCPAYKFSKRTENFGGKMYPKFCKHINKALNDRCDWHQQWSHEIQEKDGVCPKCGGETIFVRVGV